MTQAAAGVAWTQELRTFGDALRATRRMFPAALFDGEPWGRLLDRADHIPAAAAETFFGFEVRLGEESRAADFMVTVVPKGTLATHYARAGAARAATPTASLAQGLAAATAPGGWPSTRLDAAGPLLEYDVVERTPADVAAGDDGPSGVFWPVSGPITPEDADPLVAFLAILGAWREPTEVGTALRTALGRTRELARLNHVGVLAGRGVPGVRLLLAVAPRHAGTLLERLGWQGDIAKVRTLADEYDALTQGLCVSLDLAGNGSVGPRIGLELFQGGEWQRTTYGDWRSLVGHLVTRGLCLSNKARGLQQWCGLERLFHAGGTAILVRGINHVKIALEGDAVAAKAYLGMGATRYARGTGAGHP